MLQLADIGSRIHFTNLTHTQVHGAASLLSVGKRIQTEAAVGVDDSGSAKFHGHSNAQHRSTAVLTEDTLLFKLFSLRTLKESMTEFVLRTDQL